MHPEGQLQAVGNLELLEDGLEVRLDGTLGDAEGIGNGDIAFAQCGVMGHFPLTFRQRTGPVCQPGTGQPAVHKAQQAREQGAANPEFAACNDFKCLTQGIDGSVAMAVATGAGVQCGQAFLIVVLIGAIPGTTLGLVAGHSNNVAPYPGYFVIQGIGRSRVRVADARPADQGSFLIAIDADGNGVEESSMVVSFLSIFGLL